MRPQMSTCRWRRHLITITITITTTDMHFHRIFTTTIITTTTSMRRSRIPQWLRKKSVSAAPITVTTTWGASCGTSRFNFSVYFIIYVTVLILKSIARHKVKLKCKWYEHGSAKEARSLDLGAARHEVITEVHRNVSAALTNATTKYSVLAMK